MSIEKLMRKSLQQLLLIKDGRLYVKKAKTDFYTYSSLSRDDAIDESTQKLTQIVSHAFTTSPYYRKIFNEKGITLHDIIGVDNLQKIPILTKTIIQNSKEAMLSEKFSKRDLEISYTGGTSGNPTSFYRDLSCTEQRVGRQWGILERCGYWQGDRCGLIWGVHDDLLNHDDKPSLKKRVRKFAGGAEAMCCAVMDAERMFEFHRRLMRFNPVVLYGYPNAMSQFANFIRSENLQQIKVKTIICTAERLSDVQRLLLQDEFGGEVFNLYCTREHGCIGFECGEHKGFHIDSGSVHLEIISRGEPSEESAFGDIVITDLLNFGMPFIRYKIGDCGSLSADPCNCGCNLPLLTTLEGRVTDLLFRPDGKVVSGLMLIDLFLDDPSIKNIQIVQEQINRIIVNLEVDGLFRPKDHAKVTNQLKNYLSDEVVIETNILTHIPRNQNSGKFQQVICKIN